MLQIINNGQSLDLTPETAFEVIIEQPLLDESQMSVPFSTSISFPKTDKNRIAFGFMDSLMLEPQNKRLDVSISYDDYILFAGILLYDSLETNAINYSFSADNLEIDLEKKLYDLDHLPSYRLFSKTDHMFFEQAVASEEVKLPLMTNKDMADKIELPGFDESCSRLEKYQNYPYYLSASMISPAVIFADILSSTLSNIAVSDDVLIQRLNSLAVLGLYKSPSEFATITHGTILDIAKTLPEISLKEFLLNTLKLLNASIYRDGNGYILTPNREIISSKATKEWTCKVSKLFTSYPEQAQGYTFGYSNEDNSAEFSKAGISSVAGTEDLFVTSYEDISFLSSVIGEEHCFQHISEKDIFKSKSLAVENGSAALIELIAHNIPSVVNSKENMYDSTVAFNAIPSIPYNTYYGTDASKYSDSLVCYISFPSIGEERSSDCWIGYWQDKQLVSGNYTCKNNKVYSETGLSLRPQALYDSTHKVFAEWLATDRQVISVKLNLSIIDIYNFKIWEKVSIYNRSFLFKSINITLYTTTSKVEVSAELIEC